MPRLAPGTNDVIGSQEAVSQMFSSSSHSKITTKSPLAETPDQELEEPVGRVATTRPSERSTTSATRPTTGPKLGASSGSLTDTSLSSVNTGADAHKGKLLVEL